MTSQMKVAVFSSHDTSYWFVPVVKAVGTAPEHEPLLCVQSDQFNGD